MLFLAGFIVGLVLGGVLMWMGMNAYTLYSFVMVPFNARRPKHERRWWL